MKKLALRIDVTRINKEKIVPRTYEKDGKTITEQNYDMEVVYVGEKIIKTTDKYELVKVGFVAEKSEKGEDGKYINGTILGDALEFRDPPAPSNVDTGEVTDLSDIPF